jgi:predicted enzyme related to lactoylglutathione lyase
MTEMSVRLELFPHDLDAFLDFYTRVLGFVVERDDRDSTVPYASVSLGHVHIGAVRAWGDTDPTLRLPPQGVEIVLEVDDVDALRTVVAQRWELAEDLVDRPWGLRDFRLVDPEGNYLRITNRS